MNALQAATIGRLAQDQRSDTIVRAVDIESGSVLVHFVQSWSTDEYLINDMGDVISPSEV